ncbi:unnamed protein product [Prorocentrum cordatum]|uniref:Uncharacterized protein n=1 Tax=Prorocentrum cordatum TaxID=2364126 RepID=A0ABN9VBV7_9DINO|nr:unnamed protein product [Polarella glacialis]
MRRIRWRRDQRSGRLRSRPSTRAGSAGAPAAGAGTPTCRRGRRRGWEAMAGGTATSAGRSGGWRSRTLGDPASPPINRLYARWCAFREDAFANMFPAASTLPGMGPGAAEPCGAQGGVCTVVRPGDASSAAEAARIFFEHGFVVLRGALAAPAAREVLHTCRRLHEAVRGLDPVGMGNRGRGRYSFHTAVGPGQCLHLSAYARHLVDNPAVLDTLDAIFAAAGRLDVAAVQQLRHEASPAASRGGGGQLPFGAAADRATTEGGRPGAGAAVPRHRRRGGLLRRLGPRVPPLHSDYGRARPLRGAPWLRNPGYGPDAPVHVREAPPVVSVNFAVQPQHRWRTEPCA